MNQKENLLALSGEQTASHIADLRFCEFWFCESKYLNKSCLRFLQQMLSALAKLRKSSIGLATSVRPSVRIEQLGFHSREYD
jgi:hypothetical protein